MTEGLFENADQLRNALGIQNIETLYKDYTPLTDHRVGFSIQRNYPSNIRFKPPIKANGDPDKVAIIHVIYSVESLDTSNINKVPIRLFIGTFSKYLSKHFDYDFSDTAHCPTKESVQISKMSPEPLSLEDYTEYYFDHSAQGVFDSKGKNVIGREILDGIFQKHCNTVHWIKGIIIQSNLGSKNIVVKLMTMAIETAKWILRVFFGRTFESQDWFAGVLQPYKREDMRLLKIESIEISNFKASKNVAVTFSVLVIIVAMLITYSNFENKLVSAIKENSLLQLTACILTLWFMDSVMPLLILWFINLLVRWKLKIQLLSFKV